MAGKTIEYPFELEIVREVPDGLGLSGEALESCADQLVEAFRGALRATLDAGCLPRRIVVGGVFVVEAVPATRDPKRHPLRPHPVH